jgi:hypothetical protein
LSYPIDDIVAIERAMRVLLWSTARQARLSVFFKEPNLACVKDAPRTP